MIVTGRSCFPFIIGIIAVFRLYSAFAPSSLRAQEAADTTAKMAQVPANTIEKEVLFPSPDGRFAFLSTFQSEDEPQKAYDFIDNRSQKVLFRIAESEDRFNRLGIGVLWSTDSKRFALETTYNHFGSDLSVYVRAGHTFHTVKLPVTETPEMPSRLKAGHEWKTTGINDHQARRWLNDSSLVVHIESTLSGINSELSLTSERTVVLGFSPSGKVRILTSKQKVYRHKAGD